LAAGGFEQSEELSARLYMHTAALLYEQQQTQARAREQAIMPISLELRHGSVNFLLEAFCGDRKKIDSDMNVKLSNSSFLSGPVAQVDRATVS
jgi:predicted KAP-like P-loop ATPase